ncbi:hypothetical protein X832_gp102 [Pseudomonas phage PAK_P5]|uniref:Uncharacterized protein n=7 Tax=Nankokuvirus TaxID=1925779 RepID=A0A6G9LHV6_9CAUD|nr:hypothetical protein KPP10_gp099 [Pseudomonas phage KPP10]YP_008856978.1 hypothetical protein X832_gp102 [Pseudomonas phage PAK_P5]YP_008858125.1 hypothetical protein X837_gp102 [Pseudomonas phage CHA_P1]QIQ63880.1 hypothetical protein Epa24_00147 [Pseudomonas phage Epa24]QIQ64132.1 hypothetical protein Epa17_00010 [Pseudomonas phage Epa17]QIQ65026.1 hypothetical protein 16_00092 [Pseudomonas phage Epa16]QIQ65660.1 hypothetical protein 26_00024 [Pseudomonas phage Epa26]AGR89056.1 hypothet
MSNVTVWTEEFEKAAAAEGWLISSTFSESSPYEVQAIDNPEAYSMDKGVPCPPRLSGDRAAWALFLSGKEPHHSAARSFISQHSPVEWRLILESVCKDCQGLGRGGPNTTDGGEHDDCCSCSGTGSSIL